MESRVSRRRYRQSGEDRVGGGEHQVGEHQIGERQAGQAVGGGARAVQPPGRLAVAEADRLDVAHVGQVAQAQQPWGPGCR